ncbi:MAG: hypothetical protein KDA57_11505 [Planctomycetales bacterium]|nr:hypothetical protein [Planctomycetales bacterium]
MKKIAFIVAYFTTTAMQSALAAPNLQITEIWAGGLPGAEATSDWFELTNFGDMPATGLDGTLYYDDDSFDATKDDALFGVDTIAPGESVIYLVSWEDTFTGGVGDAIAAFTSMWGAPAGNLTGVQIGYVDGGSGLGGGGDTAVIFTGNTASSPPVDYAAYSVNPQVESFVSLPDGTWVDNTFAQDGVWSAYQGNFNATDDVLSTPPIGSPGAVGVPEPAGIALAATGLLLLAIRRV